MRKVFKQQKSKEMATSAMDLTSLMVKNLFEIV
jgi:hypothetical protein